MPPALRLQFEAVVEAHRRQHGSDHYDLIRNDPRFWAWTGTHLGYRGEKYLDRVIARVEAAKLRMLRLKQLPKARAVDPSPYVQGETPGKVAESATFEALLGDLELQRMTVNRELSACLDEEGNVDKPEDHEALRAEAREIIRAIRDLSKQYGALKSGEGADLLLEVVSQQFADQPERVAALLSEFKNHLHQRSGLAPKRGARE